MSTLKLLLLSLISALNAFRAYARHQRAKDLAAAQREKLRLQYEITASATDPSVPGAKLVLLNAEAKAIGEYIQFLDSESLQGSGGDGGDDAGRADNPTTRISERGDGGVLPREGGTVSDKATVEPIALTPRQVRVPRAMPNMPSEQELAGTAALRAGKSLTAAPNTWVLSARAQGETQWRREYFLNTPAAAHLSYQIMVERHLDYAIYLSEPGEVLPA